MSSKVRKPSAEELEILAAARKKYGADHPMALEMANTLIRKRHHESLHRYLFGGPVQLPVGQDPYKAMDPKTNPAMTLWVPGWVVTMDEHDDENPFKRLPDHEYLQYLTEMWIKETIMFVPKSRQLMVTWLFCAIASHELVCRPARRTAMISKKADDADEGLLGRIKTIYDLLPHNLYHVPEIDKKKYLIHCPETGSAIHALGENAERGMRGFTFSWTFSDEFSFQELVEGQYRAALATVKGKGGRSRYTGVSTPNGEDLFHQVVSDGGKIPVPAGR